MIRVPNSKCEFVKKGHIANIEKVASSHAGSKYRYEIELVVRINLAISPATDAARAAPLSAVAADHRGLLLLW